MKKASELRIPFTWENRHPVLLDRCLYIPGYYEKHEDWKILPWEDPSLFGNNSPVVIEYCSGNGQWIAEQAKNGPHLNWVAVEKRFDRARKIWALLHREKLSNLIVVCAEAVAFTRYYVPKGSVSKIFVNFPDPWPKLRHAKHRLIREEFLKEVEKILVPSGRAFFTTDDKTYVGQMLEEVFRQPLWKSEVSAPYFAMDVSNFGDSYFSTLWKKKGRNVYHLSFEVLSCSYFLENLLIRWIGRSIQRMTPFFGVLI
jgi:tRNA (guanine-N7-)-methyltransferase